MTRQSGAFIGSGAIAREHIFAMQFIDGVDVAAVCDLSPARAESTAERFAIPRWFASHTAMLDDVSADLIHITTPPQSHGPLARDCLERGFNVLIEKPVAASVAELESLHTLAEGKGLVILENQNYRTQSSIVAIREMVERGELGDVVEVQVEVHIDIHAKGGIFNDPNVPHYTASMKGGVAGDFLTHMTYIAQVFIGDHAEPQVLWNQFNRDGALGQDEFRAMLKGERAVGYLSFSGNAGPAGFWLRVIGTKGQAIANLFEPPRVAVRRVRGGAAPLATVKDGVAEAKAIFTSSFAGLYRKFSGAARYDGLQEYLTQCYAGLRDPARAPVTYEQILAGARLVEAFCAERAGR